MTMLAAVLDTNILVSALIVPIGKPAQIIAHAREQQFTLLLSEEILQETRDALHRKHIQQRFHPPDKGIEDFLSGLRDICQFVTIHEIENLIPQDPPDNIVLACAVEGGADYLVSGNLHLLALKQHRRVKIVTPAQFFEILAPSKAQIKNLKSQT